MTFAVHTATGAVSVQDPARNHRVIVQGQVVHPESAVGRELGERRYVSAHDGAHRHKCTLPAVLPVVWDADGQRRLL